ncbi:rho GTPase-activating protein 24 [Myripristis murdjan]|uniref:rho GTPase-activating protein 24 n=1 Tax=Myripristis murdjan TaxID=586833 RepID=UPI001175D1DC|nr:rho GTPase-activating protein 24-like [Myripristis murdjan]
MKEGRQVSYLSHSTYRKIKRALSFHPRVFGQRLEETVLYERRYGVRLVPLVVEQCVTFIREQGLHEVGLFRQPGQASLVKELQEAFDAGERPTFDSNTDVHTVASLLKLYLRQLPEPLVPYSRYQDYLLCGQKLSSDRMLALVELQNLLHELPVANFNLLKFICQFLNEVQTYSASNKMSCQNLATVFGPNILRAKTEDPHSIMGGAALVQLLMLELIREHGPLFSRASPLGSTRPPGHCSVLPNAVRQPQLSVASPCLRQLSLPLITECCREPAQPAAVDQHRPAHSCFTSAAANLALSVTQRRPQGHRYTSSNPENCFYPLPSTSYPLQNHTDRQNVDYQCHASRGSSPAAAKAFIAILQSEDLHPDGSKPRPVPLDWAEDRPGLGGAGARFWSSGAGEKRAAEGAVTEPASGGSSEAQEDSALSVYDNLDSASLHQRIEDVTRGHFEGKGEHLETSAAGSHLGTSEEGVEPEEAGQTAESFSSWSSCEILPLDESSCQDEGVTVGGGVSPVLSPRRSIRSPSNKGSEDDNNDNDNDDSNDDDDEDDISHPNSPASCSVTSDGPLSTGSSDVFLPSGPPDPPEPELEAEPRDAHSLLAELQQQMARQKAAYQARVQRLERCNEALKGQVAVLRVSLEQQKRCHSVAEIKIRNMERARADADRRNATLQREMEQFFKMFGEISGGGGARKRERISQTL